MKSLNVSRYSIADAGMSVSFGDTMKDYVNRL